MNAPPSPMDPATDTTDTTDTTPVTPDTPFDADLHDLAREIAQFTGVSPATARALAQLHRPALHHYAQQWDAAAARSRARVQSRLRTRSKATKEEKD